MSDVAVHVFFQTAMENFVLYDEIGKSDNCIIYKGRRKGTVVFLAIYCVEKSRRAEITNQVLFYKNIKQDESIY